MRQSWLTHVQFMPLRTYVTYILIVDHLMTALRAITFDIIGDVLIVDHMVTTPKACRNLCRNVTCVSLPMVTVL